MLIVTIRMAPYSNTITYQIHCTLPRIRYLCTYELDYSTAVATFLTGFVRHSLPRPTDADSSFVSLTTFVFGPQAPTEYSLLPSLGQLAFSPLHSTNSLSRNFYRYLDTFNLTHTYIHAYMVSDRPTTTASSPLQASFPEHSINIHAYIQPDSHTYFPAYGTGSYPAALPPLHFQKNGAGLT